MPNYKIQTSGLLIPDEQKKAIEKIIATLQGKSPSDCFISLQIASGECDVNGFLKVTSPAMNFVSSHSGINPLSVVKLLSQDWRESIKLWKKGRTI